MTINFQSTFTPQELGRYAYSMFLQQGHFLSRRDIRALSRVENDNEVPATLLTDEFMEEAEDHIVGLCEWDGIAPEYLCTAEQLDEVAACRAAVVTPLTAKELLDIRFKVARWDSHARLVEQETQRARERARQEGESCSEQ
jgi:hypothetical protein